MKIMSVDLGKARTGIAVSDIAESFAFPSCVITEYNEERLIQKVAEKAKEFGFEQAELEVVSLNARAITLYKKLGFKEVGCIPKAMKYKEGRYDKIIVMAKEL